MKTQYDVCVVGGGAAGMAAAIAGCRRAETPSVSLIKIKNWARNYMPQAMVDAIWQIQI